MSLETRLRALATRVATAAKGKANTVHTHVATTALTATGTKSSATFLRGDDTWSAPYPPVRRVSRKRTTDLTLTNGATTLLTFTSAIETIGHPVTGVADVSYASGVWTIATAGIYRVDISFNYASNATGRRQVWLSKNDGGSIGGVVDVDIIDADVRMAASGGATSVRISGSYRFAANDELRAYAIQNSGANLDLLAQSGGVPEMTFTYLGP